MAAARICFGLADFSSISSAEMPTGASRATAWAAVFRMHAAAALRLKAKDVVLFGCPGGDTDRETGFTAARRNYSSSGVFPAVGDSFILARQFLPRR